MAQRGAIRHDGRRGGQDEAVCYLEDHSFPDDPSVGEHFPYLPEAPSVNQESIDSLVVRIRALRAQDSTAVILVSLHWGQEHTLEPTPMQRSAAHRLIDAGADALICHHTHTLQTIESYRGKYIYYSLGNFIFDQDRDINRRTCVPQVKVTRDSVWVRDNLN